MAPANHPPQSADDGPPGLGDGRLSAEALARLRRRVEGGGADPYPLPDLADHAAVAAWRAATNTAWGEECLPDEPEHQATKVAGVGCLRAGPSPGAPTLLYLHGGGYALGSPGVAIPITARLAERLHVVSADYRLAPEHPFPAALDDALAVYLALRDTVGPLAVGGDSAGGGLAAALTLALKGVGAPAPTALLLLCPHLDHGSPTASADDDVAAMSASYRGAARADNPLLSPLRATPAALAAALPPTLLQTTTGDHLFPQAVRFARRVRAGQADNGDAPTSLVLDVWDGLWHTWQYHRELPEAHRALAEAARFVAEAARRHH